MTDSFQKCFSRGRLHQYCCWVCDLLQVGAAGIKEMVTYFLPHVYLFTLSVVLLSSLCCCLWNLEFWTLWKS